MRPTWFENLEQYRDAQEVSSFFAYVPVFPPQTETKHKNRYNVHVCGNIY